MRARELPFAAEMKALYDRALGLNEAGEQEEAAKLNAERENRIAGAMGEIMSLPGWQITLDLLREIVDGALDSISTTERVEFHAGQLAAVERLRERLRHCAQGPVDEYDEGLFDGD